jgi:predicted phage terminase large subunit-like protein
MLKNFDIMRALKTMPSHEREQLLKDLEALDDARTRKEAQLNFLPFVKAMWPAFIEGRHHKIMAEALDDVASGKLKRLIINLGPRHTKSEFGSFLFPAWFMGRFPDKKIIQASNTGELAVGFGRKVKNLIDTEDYQNIFPGTKLAADAKAAGRWATTKRGEYFAIGVGGTVTGKGADVLVIDDPHSEQQAKLAESNPEIYDGVYDWYTSGPRQRLQPGGAIIVIMCMTGDTDVLMGNGITRKLRDVRKGDLVATYEDGRITTAKVTNWQSNGVDAVLKVQTQSGRIIRANARHPFLVDRDGAISWVRLSELQPGMELVSLKGVGDQPRQSSSPDYAEPVRQGHPTTANTQTPHTGNSASTESGEGRDALAEILSMLRVCAGSATSDSTRLQPKRRKSAGVAASRTATASPLSSIRPWSWSVVDGVMSVANYLLGRTPVPIGVANCALITTMRPERSEGFSATTATLQSGTAERQATSSVRLDTCSVTLDPILSIQPDGEEEVFDVEIDRTENFIANGVVSHNTRWSKRDLTGQIIKRSTQRIGSDEWTVIELPAIMPSGLPLWPEFWSLEELMATKVEIGISKWNSQYMQTPTADEGALIKRDWWKQWQKVDPPKCEAVIQSWDTAFEKTQRADYSACTTWGVFYWPDDEGKSRPNVILLDAYRAKLEFPELKKKAQEKYREFEPDQLIIEKKASGAPLIYELQAMGLPVTAFTPTRGNDKIARVNAVSDLFSSGVIWYPDKLWADEVIEECASFPAGDHDDFVDSVSMALIRFRQGGWIRIDSDEEDDKDRDHAPVEYY